MIEVLHNIELNVYSVLSEGKYLDFNSLEEAVSFLGEAEYFVNPMIDVDVRYTG